MACGLNNGAMKHSCRTTQFARVVTLKLNQKSTASTFGKETQKVTKKGGKKGSKGSKPDWYRVKGKGGTGSRGKRQG